MPTQQSHLLFRRITFERLHRNWFMYYLRSNFEGKILAPYLCQGVDPKKPQSHHWCLVVIDVDEGTLTYFDPFDGLHQPYGHISDRSKLWFKSFIKYFTISKTFTENNLQNKKWKNVPCTRRRPIQRDGYNCGVFVMSFMETIARNEDFCIDFEPHRYRKYLQTLLIKESESMKETCIKCSGKIIQTYNIEQCKICQRIAHKTCIRVTDRNEIDKNFACQACKKYSQD